MSNGAFWAAASTPNVALLQQAIATGKITAPAAPERADQAKIEAIVQRLKIAQDPVEGAKILEQAGAITPAQRAAVEQKALAYKQPAIRNGGGTVTNGAQLTQYAKDILAGAGIQTGQDMEAGGLNLGTLGPALPGGVAGLLAALGVGGTAIAALGGIYGLTQMIGVQYPWETGAGEGFIAPWSRDIVQDEQGRWVTRETRPDLFGAAPLQLGAGAAYQGDPVVKTWTTTVQTKDGRMVQTPFVMFASGKIAVQRADGRIKVYKPKKHIILPRGTTTLSQAVRAQRYLDRLWRTAAKRTKAIKMA